MLPEPAGTADRSLVESVRATERYVAEFFASLTPDEFVLREGSAWTPAEHLDHLNRAVSAVARGLSAPRFLLLLRFGWGRRKSRTYEALRDDYRSRLSAGGRAGGGFIPAVGDLTSAEAALRRKELLARWGRVNERLCTALASWSDRNLDRIQLPHPLLGKITTREMIYFTIHHGQHHVTVAKSRLPRFLDG